MDTTENQRLKHRDLMYEAGLDSIFGDVTSHVAQDEESFMQSMVSLARKNHLWIIAALRSPKFPLKMGQPLYFDVRHKNGPERMKLLRNATIETRDGIRTSLDAAERVYHHAGRKVGDKGLTKANGFTRIFAERHDFILSKPDYRYISLSRLLSEQHYKIDVPLEVLIEKRLLAQHLIERKWVPAPYRKMVQNAARPLRPKSVTLGRAIIDLSTGKPIQD